MGMIAQGLGTLGYAAANGVFDGKTPSTGGQNGSVVGQMLGNQGIYKQNGVGNIVDTPAQISRVPAMSTVQNNPTLNGNSLQQFNRLSQFNNGVFQPNPFMQSIYRLAIK